MSPRPTIIAPVKALVRPRHAPLCLLLPLWAGIACAQAPESATPAAPVTSAAAQPRFDIWEYEVEGNSVLPVPAIELALQGHLGPARAMADVEAARAALEQAYQKAGYMSVGVDIPEQQISAGIVRLLVVEGRVGHLYVSGSRYHDQGRIRQRVAEFEPGRVPDFNRAQDQLASLQRGDELRLQPVLKPGVTPGTVDIDLQVKDELPLSGSVELSNQHAHGTAPLRLLGTLRYANLFQRGHALSLTFQTAPQQMRQSSAWIGNYQVELDDGGSLSLGWTHSNSDLDTLGGTQVLGRGNTWSLRRAWALGQRDVSAQLSVGVDLKDLGERTRFGSDEIATPLRYLPLNLGWTQSWMGPRERWQWSANLVLASRTLLDRSIACPSADGGAGVDDQFACKRQGGDGGFAALRLDARGQWPLGPLALHLRLSGQGASGPLVSSEQFSLGGAESVRGYAESEANGDHGLLGSAELHSPNVARWLGEAWREVTLLGFADAGRAWTLEAAAGQAPRVSLAGVGLGLRGAGPDFETALDLAWPLKATPQTPARQGPKVHARLQWRF